jgi:hypothetical protein
VVTKILEEYTAFLFSVKVGQVGKGTGNIEAIENGVREDRRNGHQNQG